MRRIPALFVLLALSALLAGSLAQTAPPRPMSLLIGKGELLQFDREIQRVAVAEPKIADAVVVSPREVMINAKGVGRTTIVIWETGASPVRYEIEVKPDPGDVERFRKEVGENLAGLPVSFTGNAEKLVLTGEVKTVEESKRAEAIAATHARTVVNLIKLPPAPDPRQILLQVRFASINRAALSEIGFNWFSRNPTTMGELSTQQFQTPRFSQLQFTDQNFSNATINFADLLNLFVFRPDLNIGATIRALEGRELLQILAEPNLITVEGKSASFLAGGEFPFPTLTATATGGAVSPVVTVQFKKFGIQLEFTPTLTASGAINLKVAPEVSSLDFTNAVTLQGFTIPAVSSRRAETEVVLKDGESFAIAGLIDNRVMENINRVKFLGDIPILGTLFRSRSTRKTSDELLVVVTPRFVRPLAPGEKLQLPDRIEAFLPSVKDEKAAGKWGRQPKKDAQQQKAQEPDKKPEFVGPRGYQEPK
jgi:pilus assembly protein CpaC